MKKMYVVDSVYGDYKYSGPYDAVRVDSVDDDRITLLCSGDDGDRRVSVHWGFEIILDDVD